MPSWAGLPGINMLRKTACTGSWFQPWGGPRGCIGPLAFDNHFFVLKSLQLGYWTLKSPIKSQACQPAAQGQSSYRILLQKIHTHLKHITFPHSFQSTGRGWARMTTSCCRRCTPRLVVIIQLLTCPVPRCFETTGGGWAKTITSCCRRCTPQLAGCHNTTA